MADFPQVMDDGQARCLPATAPAVESQPSTGATAMKNPLPLLRPAALALAATLLVACASTPRPEAQWVDPALGAQSRLLQGQKVLVACDAYDAAVRQICQDALFREVLAKGAQPVVLPAGATFMTDRELDGQLVGSAAGLGARAVIVLALTPATASAGSGVSLGIGGFSFGRGGGGGIGLGVPIGGSQVSTGFSANGRVTDARTGRLVWTTSFVAAPSQDLRAQSGALAKSVIDAAQAAGLF